MTRPVNLDTLRELELLDVLPHLWRTGTPAGAPATSPEAPQRTSTPAVVAPGTQRAPKAPIAAQPLPVPADPARAARIAALDWRALNEDMAACRACRLCERRKQAVPGVGALDASWLFVGEGPGAEEDEQGEPFVGQAGKLLDAMLAAAGLQRGREVYIANVVKCRPPGNRTPSPDEAEACAPYLDRQINLIRPKIIVALGKTAVTRLTGRDTSMASLRLQRFEYQGIPLVATYHPAYLLRNLPDKLKAWEDLVFARRVRAETR
ncbi:MAG: uracil-DNA glycosylase [Betaproteobacteria bacterium]|nr:uracil-DNA glycosylase [Betaproteobacteria bacterium]